MARTELPQKPRRVLGIDPGYERVGFALVESRAGRETVLVSGCLRTSATTHFHERLREIGEHVTRLVREYAPDAMGIETLFINTNQKTAMRVAEARGVILYAACSNGLRVLEYSPLEIKVTITGFGRADKTQIAAMIERLVVFEKRPRLDDEYDAIAVALTTLARA